MEAWSVYRSLERRSDDFSRSDSSTPFLASLLSHRFHEWSKSGLHVDFPNLNFSIQQAADDLHSEFSDALLLRGFGVDLLASCHC